jgi:protein-S-isoprenylcysteine O-methyltransferase Ste14
MLHEQVRREEPFLTQAYGDAYRDYCTRVGRYARWRV